MEQFFWHPLGLIRGGCLLVLAIHWLMFCIFIHYWTCSVKYQTVLHLKGQVQVKIKKILLWETGNFTYLVF